METRTEYTKCFSIGKEGERDDGRQFAARILRWQNEEMEESVLQTFLSAAAGKTASASDTCSSLTDVQDKIGNTIDIDSGWLKKGNCATCNK